MPPAPVPGEPPGIGAPHASYLRHPEVQAQPPPPESPGVRHPGPPLAPGPHQLPPRPPRAPGSHLLVSLLSRREVAGHRAELEVRAGQLVEEMHPGRGAVARGLPHGPRRGGRAGLRPGRGSLAGWRRGARAARGLAGLRGAGPGGGRGRGAGIGGGGEEEEREERRAGRARCCPRRQRGALRRRGRSPAFPLLPEGAHPWLRAGLGASTSPSPEGRPCYRVCLQQEDPLILSLLKKFSLSL